MNRGKISTGILLLLSCLLTACSLGEIKAQSEQIHELGLIEGQVVIHPDYRDQLQGDIYVLLFIENNGVLTFDNQYLPAADGSYNFHVLPASYTVAAFVDSDGDGKFQEGNPGVYLGMEQRVPELVNIEKNGQKQLPTLVIEPGKYSRPDVVTDKTVPAAVANIGKIVSLQDAMFSEQNAALGLWQPMSFLNNVGGGLYMLQDYQPGKIPVIFVHGINGHSANFADITASLDRDRFQPWVLYYPSGLRLDMVSDYLVKAVQHLYVEYKFEEFYVVAHSMGGLMTRSFVLKYDQENIASRLGLVVTINSPLYGMDSAASGVKNSPIVVPSWRDVASQSDYVKRVHATPWPQDVPYHLVFSHQPGIDGDGVVAMSSQISRSLQGEAEEIVGFEAEHSGILRDQAFIAWLNQLLAQSLSSQD